MKRSLLAQVYPTYIIVVIACIAALSLVATTVVRSFVYDFAKEELSDLISVTANQFYPDESQGASGPDADEQIKKLFAGRDFRVTILAIDGKVIADSKADTEKLENHATRPEVIMALSRGEGDALRRSESIGTELLYLAKPVLRSGAAVAVIRASMPLPLLRDRLGNLYGRLAIGGALVLFAAALLALFVTRRINRPLEQLAQTARRFGQGDLDHRAHVTEPNEIRTLADTMNSMAEELRRRIEDVEHRRREAEAILGGMAEGVIVLDRDLRITQTNAAAMKLLPSVPSGTPIGKTLLEVFRATELRRFAEQALESEQSVEGMLTIWAESPRHLQVYAVQIPGREGCLLVVHDMTRLVKLENVRKDFVANVSHELKTPITSIKGFVETLVDGALDDPERAKRYLGIVAKHADRLERIVEDLLALARLEQQDGLPLETERMPLASLVEDASVVCGHAAEEKGITIEVLCPQDIEVNASPTLLEQAFVNLLDNAIKYSGVNSVVRIEAARSETAVVVGVIDRGCGIPAKDLPRIFERFYRVDKARSREEGGTGLGLSIVKHVVALHGGSVSAESREGVGSTFTITFPTEPAEVVST